jgi:putative ABC transport system permease protein
MRALNLITIAFKYVVRNRTRSILTVFGVATGMFLFGTIETMQDSLKNATEITANDTTLVVYRENRYCPSTSRLPEYYKDEIKKIKGVESVIPVQIVVNNCGTSLDVVVFRGIPADRINAISKNIEVLNGSVNEWLTREDGALIGANLAQRRRLDVGDSFDAAGVTVVVSGIIRSAESSQDDNVAYVHLPFLQQASRVGLGTVTQFLVKVSDSSLLNSVSRQIDNRFKTESEPTDTTPEKAFFASTAKELIELIGFSRWIGIASVFAVIGLIANTILIAVRSKISEHAILKTIGYSQLSISWLIISEAIILSVAGGITGIGGASIFLHLQKITIGNEGLALAFIPSFSVWLKGFSLSLLLGIVAGVYPAWLAGRQSIASNLRTA